MPTARQKRSTSGRPTKLSKAKNPFGCRGIPEELRLPSGASSSASSLPSSSADYSSEDNMFSEDDISPLPVLVASSSRQAGDLNKRSNPNNRVPFSPEVATSLEGVSPPGTTPSAEATPVTSDDEPTADSRYQVVRFGGIVLRVPKRD